MLSSSNLVGLLQIENAIAAGRMALRVERDKRDWLVKAIEQGRLDLIALQSSVKGEPNA